MSFNYPINKRSDERKFVANLTVQKERNDNMPDLNMVHQTLSDLKSHGPQITVALVELEKTMSIVHEVQKSLGAAVMAPGPNGDRMVRAARDKLSLIV